MTDQNIQQASDSPMETETTQVNVPLFLGMDKTQLGVVLVVAKAAEQMKELIDSDLMQSAFNKLREEYQGKSQDEQLQYVRSLHALCSSSVSAGLFGLGLITQTEQNLTNAMLAQKNIESISK